MVAMESPREIPGVGSGPTETERSEPTLSRACQRPETSRARAVSEAARVITAEHFRPLLRPARLLPEIRAPKAKSLQRFCSRECRRALERVQERERHWKGARDLIRKY